MLKSPRRQNHSASQANCAHSRQRELTTKRRGELAELAFALKAASLGFGVSKPFGDSERYDSIVDSRNITKHPCDPQCEMLRSLISKRKGKAKSRNEKRNPDDDTRNPNTQSHKPEACTQKSEGESLTPVCPALYPNAEWPRPKGCSRRPAPLWRVQVKCSTQLLEGLYRLNAHRRTGCTALPYLPGEIDFLAAYIIPEDTWYIIPLEAFIGRTSLLFRRSSDRKPGLYDQYKEAWHLLRPK